MSECLPGPTKIVVFRDAVFKLKYKLSEHSIPVVTFTPSVQADLKRITSAVLDRLLDSQPPVPLKTDYMAVYPGLVSWSLVQANKLQFFHNGRHLRAHPQTVYLLVHVFAPPTATELTNEIWCGVKRPHPDDEVLPAFTGVLSSEVITRKKLRLDTEPSEGQIPSTLSDPHLPTEHAQTKPRPSPGTISKVAMTMKSEFELLRRPMASSNEHSKEVAKNELSFISTIVRSVKGLFGWT